MQPTHQSHFTVQQSSKFSQPGALIFILGVTVQQSQVCSRSYQSSAMVSNVLRVCLCVSVIVYLHVYVTGSRVRERTESHIAASIREAMAHSLNLQRQIHPLSQTQGQRVLCSLTGSLMKTLCWQGPLTLGTKTKSHRLYLSLKEIKK